MSKVEKASQIEKALMVFLLDKKIRFWLSANDPKALEQAKKALFEEGSAELRGGLLAACTSEEVRKFSPVWSAYWDTIGEFDHFRDDDSSESARDFLLGYATAKLDQAAGRSATEAEKSELESMLSAWLKIPPKTCPNCDHQVRVCDLSTCLKRGKAHCMNCPWTPA